MAQTDARLPNEPTFDRLTTPKGRGRYLWLREPDTKFDADGVFQGTLLLPVDEPATKQLLKVLDAAHSATVAWAGTELKKSKKPSPKSADLPYIIYEDDSEDAGLVGVRFKAKAKGKNRKGGVFTRTIPLFDAAGQPLAEDVTVGSGSTIRVSLTPVPFYTKLVGAGITLRLEAVQVIKAVSFGGKTADAYGFGDESAENFSDDETAEESSDSATEDEDGDGDF